MVKSISLGTFSSVDELITAANLALANALGKAYDETNKCIWISDKLAIKFYGDLKSNTYYPICRFSVRKTDGTVVDVGYNILYSSFSSVYPYTIRYDARQYHVAFGISHSGAPLNSYFSDLAAQCADGKWYGVNVVYEGNGCCGARITNPEDATCKKSYISVKHEYGDDVPCSMFALPNPYNNTVFRDVYVVLSAPLDASVIAKQNMILNGVKYNLFSSVENVYNVFAIET